MSKQALFSIIVPVYKVEAYLDRCIQSLINQTYPEIEIILVDDGSPDRCGQICREYARRDSRIKVIHKENGGQAEARNVGIAAATGTYLLFVDGDDFVSPEYCEKLQPFAAQNCDVIVVDAAAEGGSRKMRHFVGDHRRVFRGKEYLLEAYRSGGMPMAAVLYVYRRGFWLEKGLQFKCGIVHEDDHLAARAFLLAESVMDSGLCEYTYVLREDSTTTRRDQRKNGRDMYTVCLDLQPIFENLEESELKMWLLDSLAVKLLHIFQAGRLYQYGGEYIHKKFIWQSAKRPKTRCKAALYCLSPRLYWYINNLSKRLKKERTERRK